MVSIAVLSVGLVMIIRGFSHSFNVLRIAEDNLKATLVAENQLAQAQIEASQANINKEKDLNGILKKLENEFKKDNVEFIWRVDVFAEEDWEDLKRVEADLTWSEGKREGLIRLVTYIKTWSE